MNRDIPEIILSYADYLSVIQEKASSTVYGYRLDVLLFMDYLKTKGKYQDLEFDENFIKLIELKDI